MIQAQVDEHEAALAALDHILRMPSGFSVHFVEAEGAFDSLRGLPAYEELKQATGLHDGQIAYVGDDVVDLPVMTRVGLAIAVQDAHALAKQHAHWVTPSGGGRGAAREACELIMDAQGRLQDLLDSYIE